MFLVFSFSFSFPFYVFFLLFCNCPSRSALSYVGSPLTPNDPYRGRTAPLTSKRCISYIYSTNIGTGYFKHGIYSPFFLSLSLQNAVCFIILTYLVPVLFTFYIHSVLKIKKKNSGAKRVAARSRTGRRSEMSRPLRNAAYFKSFFFIVCIVLYTHTYLCREHCLNCCSICD